MTRNAEAIALNDRGNACRAEGNWQAAIEYYERAATLDPHWSAPHYNLGLVYKYQNRWTESLVHNQHAVTLDSHDQAAWWNLGIAATALSDWKTARHAWQSYGIQIPAGDGPIDFPCGMSPIRLNPNGPNTEVVWANRLCPARAELVSIPLPESEHRWRDVVLNDGAPVGYRKFQGQDRGVYNELELLQISRYGTFLVEVEMIDESRSTAPLQRLTENMDLAIEDWTTNIQVLCKACSEGRPHDEHDSEGTCDLTDGQHRVAIAALQLSDVQTLLDEWQKQAPDIKFGRIRELIPPRG